MSEHGGREPDRGTGGGEGVAERNIARLVGEAYAPEVPGVALTERIKGRLAREASMIATTTSTTTPAAAAAAAAAAGSTDGRADAAVAGRIGWARWAPWVAGAVAAAVLIGLLVRQLSTPAVRPGGTPQLAQAPDPDPASSAASVASADAAATPATRPAASAPEVLARLMPRARLAGAVVDPVRVGSTIETRPGEKRRVTLADGTALYVNQNARVTIDGERRITVAAGEVFLEVAPKPGAATPEQATFIVKAGGREVTALGTKFSVAVDERGTGVMVTQGKVRVSGDGAVGEVRAGQRLPAEKAAGGAKVEAAPRASAVLDWTADLMAAAESPLVPRSEFEGGALVVVDPWGQESRLTLRKFNVDVYVEDGFARTCIDQTYFNHEHRRQEGTFYFPLPPDAQLSRLAMYVEGRLMEGGMAERDHARAVYESIVYSQRDPALLEWVDGSTFKMRVFPLEPRQEKRIILEYTQKLPEQYAMTDYRFPSGHNLGIVRDWSFNARVKDGARGHWTSGTHALAASVEGDDLLLSASARHVKVDRDVAIRLTDTIRAGALVEQARFASLSNEMGRFLVFRYRPNLTAQPVRERRDWVFLFESSGNRDPVLARAQVDVVKGILENAEREDTFAIVTAATRARRWADGPRSVTPENVAEAIAFLERTHLVGALDLAKGFEAAAPLLAAGKNPWLVHVGAGVSTLGERAPERLAEKVPGGARYVGVGVGKAWSRALMKAAAARTGGHFTQINPDEPIAWRAFELVSTLDTPRLLDVKVASDAGDSAPFLVYADSLSHGEELVAVARLDGAMPKQVTVAGTVDGRPFERKVAVEEAQVKRGAGYAARLWAKLEIDRLLKENAEQNRAKIVELSKRAYVMSPFTSLLVLENEKMYEEFKVDRGRKDHWAMFKAPERIEVVYEPDPDAPWWARRPENLPKEQPQAKKKPAEVLETILVRIPATLLHWPDQNYGYQSYGVTAGSYLSGAYAYGGWGGARGTWDHRWRSSGSGGGWGGSGSVDRWAERNELLGVFEFDGDVVADKLAMPARPAARPVGGPMPAFQPATRFDRFLNAEALREESPGRFRANKPMASGIPGALALRDLSARRRSLRLDPLMDRESEVGERLALSIGGRQGMFLGRRAEGKKQSQAEFAKFVGRQAAERVLGAYGAPRLIYQPPRFNWNDWALSDLVQYAPGLNTTFADILGVLEAEAERPGGEPGSIDAKARALIDRARAIGWRKVTVREDAAAPYAVTFDGAGRYAFERELPNGLTERVICDGTRLWHLYPALGLGSVRQVRAAHRAELSALVPWALPPAEDLAAAGTDVTLVDERTVGLVAKGPKSPPATAPAATPEAMPAAMPAATRPAVEAYRLELVFDAADGRLAERRIVELPSGKVLARQTYAADGTVTTVGADGKAVATEKLEAGAAAAADDVVAAPDLSPDLSKLLVVPMPIRTREHYVAGRGLGDDGNFVGWSDEDVLAVAMSSLCTRRGDVAPLLTRRFLSRGDRRPGLFVLLLASRNLVGDKGEVNLGDGRKATLEGEKDPAAARLAAYVAAQARAMRSGNARGAEAPVAVEGDKLLHRLATLRYLYGRFNDGSFGNATPTQRASDRELGLEIVRNCADETLAWTAVALLGNYGNYGGERQQHYRALAAAMKELEARASVKWMVRYERARFLAQAGDRAEAREAFEELFEAAVAEGVLPSVEHHFRNAFQSDAAGQERYRELMRSAYSRLVERGGRRAGIYLAWQVYQLGDQPLAEELLGAALLDVPADEALSATLAAVEMLWHTGQYARADALIEPLLEEERFAALPELWRIASAIASQRGMLARSLSRQERALDLEYAQMPAVVDLQAVRQDYLGLLQRYQQLADAIATLEKEPPKELLARTVRAADRWRAIDPDDTHACRTAAGVLRRLGAVDLAWDYLTTPLADKPNEAAPWQSMAWTLRQQGDFELADKAYATAYELEPTNAQLLWERAQLLQQTQRHAEAREIYKKIAEGTWQPRFQWIQRQAQAFVR